MKDYLGTITLLFIGLLSHYTLSGQEKGFSFLLTTDRDEYVTNVIEDDNNNFYMGGTIRNEKTFDYDSCIGFIYKVNNFGELTDSVIFGTDTIPFYLADILYLGNDTLLTSGYTFDETNPWYSGSFFLQKLNTDLNIIQTNSFAFADTISFGRFTLSLTQSDEILMSGTMRNGFDTDPIHGMLSLFSRNLDSIQMKMFFDECTHMPYPKQLNDGRYFVIGSGYTGFIPRYMVFDSAFTFLFEQRIPTIDYLNNPFGAKWDTDTSFYLIAHWIDDGEDELGLIHQKSINQFENYEMTSWGLADTMDFPALYHGVDFNHKDSIYWGGTVAFQFDYFIPIPSWYSVIQTDSLLNVRWERFYGGDAHYVMNKLLATSDGGCLLAGSKYDYMNTNKNQRDIYVLKLNNQGLITGKLEKPNVALQEAIVFPNPGTNQIKVRIAAQYPQCIFELYDVNGNKVISQEIIGKWGETNTSFLSPGSYVYQIHNNEGLFETGKWVKH